MHNSPMWDGGADRASTGPALCDVYGRFAKRGKVNISMTTFDDREKAFENRFVHDQELAFRAEARRNRKVGLWAAGLLGRVGAEAETYAASVLATGTMGGGSEAVVQKILEDVQDAGLNVSEHRIRKEMESVLAQVLERLKVE